jgi:hypothetical protein
MPRWYLALLAGVLGLGLWAALPSSARAQQVPPPPNIGQYFYYPYYYFPHNYWPQQGPQWPEPPGAPYMRPPAYMAYPPFKEPHWHYHWYEPKRYYRGFHFWLDQF